MGFGPVPDDAWEDPRLMRAPILVRALTSSILARCDSLGRAPGDPWALAQLLWIREVDELERVMLELVERRWLVVYVGAGAHDTPVVVCEVVAYESYLGLPDRRRIPSKVAEARSQWPEADIEMTRAHLARVFAPDAAKVLIESAERHFETSGSVDRPSAVREPSADRPPSVRGPSVDRPSAVREPSADRPPKSTEYRVQRAEEEGPLSRTCASASGGAREEPPTPPPDPPPPPPPAPPAVDWPPGTEYAAREYVEAQAAAVKTAGRMGPFVELSVLAGLAREHPDTFAAEVRKLLSDARGKPQALLRNPEKWLRTRLADAQVAVSAGGGARASPTPARTVDEYGLPIDGRQWTAEHEALHARLTEEHGWQSPL